MSRTVSVVTLALLLSVARAGAQSAGRPAVDVHGGHTASAASDLLVSRVREATSIYRDLDRATAAGYRQFGGCVSGPEAGAMGVHFVNSELVDGRLEVDRPEALIYEIKNGVARLLGVEYITPVPVWDAQNQDLPILAGHHLQYFGSPNRYRLPALYELHVWAWQENPNGTYVDWNPTVSCDGAK